MVGQNNIAHFLSLGCRVIGFAGTPAKLEWLKSAGVDVVANYKTTNISELLTKEAPKGVNCYFDNVSCFCCRNGIGILSGLLMMRVALT